MDRLTMMETFVQVAESGSFSAAADSLRSTQSNVSKLIRALEKQLNVTLFARTTRKVTMTEEAERLLPSAKALVERYAAAIGEVSGGHEPRGHIRFLTGDAIGRVLVLPALVRFFARYPQITIEHIVTDRKIDLVENKIDLALRVGHMKDSSYRSRRIGVSHRITVAAPAYLKSHGTPKTPTDLAAHNCIRFIRLVEYTGTTDAWEYIDPKTNLPISILANGSYSSDNSFIIRQAAVSGLGICLGPSWIFRDDLSKGKLKEILSSYRLEPYEIFLMRPAVDYTPLRMKVLMEYLAGEFSVDK